MLALQATTRWGAWGGQVSRGEEPHTDKRCVLTLISANEACMELVLWVTQLSIELRESSWIKPPWHDRVKQPGGGEERKAGLAADPQLLPSHCYCLCHPGTSHPMGALPWPQTSSLEALPKKYTRAVEWAGEGLTAAGRGSSCFCWHWHSSLESHWYPRVPTALGSWGMGKAKVWGFARSQ